MNKQIIIVVFLFFISSNTQADRLPKEKINNQPQKLDLSLTSNAPNLVHATNQFREVNQLNYEYIGAQTRIGIGVDTEFDGTADISHFFTDTNNQATSGDAWFGFDFSGKDKGVNSGGLKINHHWVNHNSNNQPLGVRKVFAAYDRNADDDDKLTIGYGQEVDRGFWEAYVAKGLSGKRKIGSTINGLDLFEKGYEYNVGGRLGTFLPQSHTRVRGGLDYAWDNEHGTGENNPDRLTLSMGVEKFFRGTPHSFSLNVSTSLDDGGHGDSHTDTRANLSYRYDFGSANLIRNSQQFAWVKRALHNSIHHDRYISIYQTTAGSSNNTGNDHPVANGDTATTTERTPVTIDVLANDTGNGLTITNVTQATNGTASIVNGNIVYTPAQGFTGTDNFIYTITDDTGSTSSGVVTLTVANDTGNVDGDGTNTAPIANDDNATSNGGAVSIDTLANDRDPDGDILIITSTSQPTNGLSFIANGNIIYTPDQGFVGTDTFKYTISDGNGEISTATVTVVVTDDGTNSAPFTRNDTATSTGQSVTIDILANDTDPDGDKLVITNVSQPLHGTVSIANGNIVYTPAVGFTGIDTFIYSVSDSNGGTSSATVAITITDNDTGNVALVANNDSATSNGSAITIDVLGNDSSTDNDILILTNVSQPANGTAFISAGQIVYTPNSGFTGTDTFTYTISDDSGHTSIATVAITVISP